MVNPILRDNDRKVKVFSNGTPVSASPLQSVYAKYLNFIGLTVSENAPLNAYDVTAGATTDEKVASYINGTQVGSVARKLNFSTDFTGSDDSGNGRTNIGLATPVANTVLPDGTTTTKSKIGTFYGGSVQGNGLFAGLTVDGTATVEQGTSDLYTVFTTPATDDEIAGISTPLAVTRRAYNPVLKVRFKPNLSTERIFVGLHSDAVLPVSSNSVLDSKSGVGVVFYDVISNYTAKWNNGAGTAQSFTGATKDAAVHTITFTLNDAAGSVTVNFDGTNIVNASTTTPPASTTALYLHVKMEAIGATASPIAINYAYITQDK